MVRAISRTRSTRGRIMEAASMSVWYAVGIKIGSKADHMTVEAEDALIAALKVKSAHPEAAVTYVRKQNARGDRRHPHADQISDKPAEMSANPTAPSTSPDQ